MSATDPAFQLAARITSWFASGDTGVSSQAIAATMMGTEITDPFGAGYPHDPADLGRCLRLLELFPEWKPRIGEMAKHGKTWAALVARWHELEASMRDEVGIHWEKGKRAPRTFELMQAIRKEFER